MVPLDQGCNAHHKCESAFTSTEYEEEGCGKKY